MLISQDEAGDSLVIRSRRMVLPDGVRAAALVLSGGRIAEIKPHDFDPGPARLYDAGSHVVMPGLVDTHVHMNEPGRTDWEGFETATRAAAAGGVTTVIDMPLNGIPALTSGAAFEARTVAAAGRIAVDVGFWGGVVPGNSGELAGLSDVFGFKCFLVDSGVPEFPASDETDLRSAFRAPGGPGPTRPLLVHAELPEPLARALQKRPSDADPRSHRTWLESRPPESELEAIDLCIRLARETGAAIHIVHLSTAAALDPLARARADGLPITVETCPHYLVLSAEEIADGATLCKCAPPIRGAANRELLWEGLRNGVIDAVVSDHSPSPPALKCLDTGDFDRAWGGIASLQLGLPLVWTAAEARGIAIERIADWMGAAPARLARLEGLKGAIAVGKDADLVVFDPEAEFTVRGEALYHRHKLTPYEGRRLRGAVQATFLRGKIVFEAGVLPGKPRGVILRRSALSS